MRIKTPASSDASRRQVEITAAQVLRDLARRIERLRYDGNPEIFVDEKHDTARQMRRLAKKMDIFS